MRQSELPPHRREVAFVLREQRLHEMTFLRHRIVLDALPHRPRILLHGHGGVCHRAVRHGVRRVRDMRRQRVHGDVGALALHDQAALHDVAQFAHVARP